MPFANRTSGLDRTRRLAAVLGGSALWFCCGCWGSALAQTPGASGGRPPWLAEASITIKAWHDDNVFFQKLGPLADRGAYVSSVTPTVAVRLRGADRGGPRDQFLLSYAPEIITYRDESEQDHWNHRVGLSLTGRRETVSWELRNAFTWTDGRGTAQDWPSPAGFPRAPVIGGPEYRSRTENIELRGSAMLRRGIGSAWFLRPRAEWWGADFRTEQRINQIPDPDGSFYGNYVDRFDVHGGFDLGRQVAPRTFVTLGYRAGKQDQGPLNGNGFQYDNDYQVVLVGVERAPGGRVSYSLQVGPDFRSYHSRIRPGGDRHPLEIYANGRASLSLLENTRAMLMLRLFKFMPGGGEGAMAMRMGIAEVQQAVSDAVDLKIRFRVYGGEMDAPDPRGSDWLYTGFASATWKVSARFQAGLEYQLDLGRSAEEDVFPTPQGPVPGPNATGREYERNLLAVVAKLTL